MEDKKISYIIEYDDGKEEKKDFHKLNKYSEFLNDAKKVIDIKIKTDMLIKKIKKMNLEELIKVFEIIDENL